MELLDRSLSILDSTTAMRRAGRTMAFAGGLLLAACAGIRAAVILGGI